MVTDGAKNIRGNSAENAHRVTLSFQKQVSIKLRNQWPSGTAKGKWAAMKTSLSNAAEKYLGLAKRKQPDWFKESSA